MSVYIDMEMPTSCGSGKCKLFDASHAIGLFSPLGWCRVNGKEIFRLSEKADFCPLVPVPEPHGRLIDASEKIRVQIYDDMTEDYHMVKMTIDDLLCQGWVEADVPTIIPASEEAE